MKKTAVLILLVALMVPVHMTAQTSSFSDADSEHYRVLSELGAASAQETADKLESLFGLFNEYFHFDVDELPASLRVRIFSSKDRFDTYLTRVIDETRDDFVYLHYTDLAKSELVGYAMEEEAFEISLKHQSFIQYLRAFIPNPPLWLREGFAVFFEEVAFDNAFGTAEYRENLAWLETLQSIVDLSAGYTPIPLSEMLRINVDEARDNIEVFYPQAWGMVSFLLRSDNRDHNRLMWDTISALSSEATLSENSENVWNAAFQWEEENRLIEAFATYVQDRRSFRGLVQDGIDYYADGNLAAAEESFVTALKAREDNFIPYYYMGLISYDKKDWVVADYYYNEALDKGATEALTFYALGVNAYAANNFDEAISYLEATIEADPVAYQTKAQQLLDRIEG